MKPVIKITTDPRGKHCHYLDIETETVEQARAAEAMLKHLGFNIQYANNNKKRAKFCLGVSEYSTNSWKK